MKLSRRDTLRLTAAGTLAGALPAVFRAPARAEGNLRVAMLVERLGDRFFEACRDGGLEAAKALGNVDAIYAGPVKGTAEEQVRIIEQLIEQKVDGLAVSAVEPAALGPIARKAIQRGVKIVSFGSPLPRQSRSMQLDPSSPAQVGQKCLQLTSDAIGNGGAVAILSSRPEAQPENAWIGEMKRQWVRPEHDRMKLVAQAYGDGAEKAYDRAQELLEAHSDLRAIVAFSPAGTAAAAKAVIDAGRIGKTYVTGLGIPSAMKDAIAAGATKAFAYWNPVDLGYSALYIAAQIALGRASGAPDTRVSVGRIGDVTIGPDGAAAMGDPLVFDKSNIEKFAAVF